MLRTWYATPAGAAVDWDAVIDAGATTTGIYRVEERPGGRGVRVTAWAPRGGLVPIGDALAARVTASGDPVPSFPVDRSSNSAITVTSAGVQANRQWDFDLPPTVDGQPIATGSGGGEQGERGPAGPAGKSAYELALAAGFVGDFTAWMTSLVGARGPAGTNGTNGTNGTKGEQGERGPLGPTGWSAYDQAVAGGFVGTPAAWLASLVGPRGLKGTDGTNGTDGAKGDKGDRGLTGQGFTFRGAWAAATTYAAYDVVTYLGSNYVAPAAFTSGATFDPTKWTTFTIGSPNGVLVLGATDAVPVGTPVGTVVLRRL